MPDENTKLERVYVRVTPETKAKLERLSAVRDMSMSDLLRGKGVEGLVEEHDRIMEMAAGSAQGA